MRPAQHFPSPVSHLSVMGTSVQNLVTGPQSQGKLALSLVGVPKQGMGVPSHTHDREDEYFHVLRGRVLLIVGGIETTLGPGQSATGPRQVVHSWEALTDDVQMLVGVTPAGLDAMFVDIDAARPGQNDVETVKSICRRYGIEFA
jgi:quercetin dioxygenase-like cupin family protein